ncbi:MAG TPA: cyanophycinase [Candidatus Peribacteraceae bacterium]|nr:cyanophycinase [Candidatus Peribacteraceae bacterium]
MSTMQRETQLASHTVDEPDSKNKFPKKTSKTLKYMRGAFAALLMSLASTVAAAENAETEPVRHPGTLVVVGGGDLPDEVSDLFFKLAGDDESEIALIPTASVYADDAKDHLEYLLKNHARARIVHILHTYDRAKADDPAFSKPLETATGVWIAGGRQQLLSDAYAGTLVQKRLHEVLQRGGVIGGTSAGASILSNPAIIDGTNTKANTGPGFGLLQINGRIPIVDQHFSERNRKERLLRLMTVNPTRIGFGIDEKTALIKSGNRMSVLGRGGVSLFSSDWKQVFHTGEDIVIPSLQVAGTEK